MQRRLYRGAHLQRAVSIADLQARARRRLPAFVREYVEGGAEDEHALAGNIADFSAWRLQPGTLADVRNRHTRTTLFGVECAAPLVIAPTGLNGLICRDADLKLARAAATAGVPFTLSTVSNVRLERLATESGAGRRWMQLYMLGDRGITEDIVARAAAAGYEALVFTSDAQVFGNREWDLRCYAAPGRLSLRHRLEALRHPRWLLDVVGRGLPRFENLAPFYSRAELRADRGVFVLPPLFRSVDWQDLRWLRSRWPGKLLLKGVLTATDARRAAEEGCDGVVISNHGGRQLDDCVSALDVLPEIVGAVGARLTILVDGGIRRGRDIAKALALGAHAAMIGRAALYGLAAGGQPGAARALELLVSELLRTLGQLGCANVGQLGPHHLRRR
jgi:(S)-mandelate dehydrogenase